MDPVYLDSPSASVQPFDQTEIDDEEDEEDQLDSDLEDDGPGANTAQPSTNGDSKDALPKERDGEQLEPESEEEVAPVAYAANGSASVQRQRPSGVRIPGETLLPQVRVENILRADGESGPMSKEAMFMLSIATEEFIKRFIQTGCQHASIANRNVISYQDMAAATLRPEFSYLQDVVPAPLPLNVALSRRALKEKELLEEDPALTAAAPLSPLPPPSIAPVIPHPSPLPPPNPGSPSVQPQPSKRARANGKGKAKAEVDPEKEKERRAANRRARAQQRQRERAAETAGAGVAGEGEPSDAGQGEAAAAPAPVAPPPERPRVPRVRDSRGRYSTGGSSGSSSRRNSRRSEPVPSSLGATPATDAESAAWTASANALNGLGESGEPMPLAGPASGYMGEVQAIRGLPGDREAEGYSTPGMSGEDVFGAVGRTIYSAQ